MARGRAVNGAGSIRQRPNGTWEVRYCNGRDPGTGQLIRKSKYAKTAEEAAQILRAATAAIDTGDYIDPEKMPLREWMKLWLNEYIVDVKPGTVTTYETQTRMHIVPALGATPLCELRAHNIQVFINSLSRAKENAPALSAKTIKNVYGVLRRALEQATEIGYLKTNPAAACKLPRVDKTEIQPLDDDAMTRFLGAIKGDPNELLYIADAFTGLRKGELLGLTWDCIDFETGTVKVYRQLQLLKGVYSFAPLKNDKPRHLTPSRYVMDAFKEQRTAQNKHRLKAGAVWANKDKFVFTNEIGGHLLHQTVYKQYKRIVASIGLPDARFHDLRHSYAVLALKHGDDPKTVQTNLGHATASFTLDTYGHTTTEMQRASAARMDATIEGLKGNK